MGEIGTQGAGKAQTGLGSKGTCQHGFLKFGFIEPKDKLRVSLSL